MFHSQPLEPGEDLQCQEPGAVSEKKKRPLRSERQWPLVTREEAEGKCLESYAMLRWPFISGLGSVRNAGQWWFLNWGEMNGHLEWRA